MANNSPSTVKPPLGPTPGPPSTGPNKPPIRCIAAIGIGVFNVFALLFLVWSGHIPAVLKLNPSELVAEASEALGLTGIAQFVKPKAAPWATWRETLQMVEFVDHARDVRRAASFHVYLLLPSQNAGYRNGKWIDAMLRAKVQRPAALARDQSALLTASQMLFYLPTLNRNQTLSNLWRQSMEPPPAALATLDGEGAGATDLGDDKSDAGESDDGNSDRSVADSGKAELAALVLEVYDHDLARQWLSAACARSARDCLTTGFSGPYVMIAARAPQDADQNAGDDFLLIDFTPIREPGFSAVVAGLHEAAAVAAPQGQRLAELQARLAAIDLPSSAWIAPFSGDLGQLAQLVSAKQIQ
jgi:hypothetical protein